MKLWVLRHGEAVPYGSCPDSERELTAHGRQEALSSAARLIGQPLTAIYASPYLRAQQTAQIVREALGFEPEIRTVDWLTPETDPDKVTDQLVSVSNVLLVSHNLNRLNQRLDNALLISRNGCIYAPLRQLLGQGAELERVA